MKTKYTLFISHSAQEKNVAQAIKTTLSNAFTGDLRFFFSPEMKVGTIWKDYIQTQLGECDAGLFVLTPEFQKSHWFTAEFTAFWLQGKPTYILTMDDDKIDSNSFIDIMNDTQRGSLNSVDNVKGLIVQLAKSISKGSTIEIPYDAAEVICRVAAQEYNKAIESHRAKLFSDIKLRSDYIQFRYTADDIMLLNDEQLLAVMGLVSNNNYLRLLLQKIVVDRRSNNLITIAINSLGDEINGDNTELGNFVIFLAEKGLFNEDFFSAAIGRIRNDTTMIRVLKALYKRNPQLSLEYYLSKRNSNGERFITGETQIKRIEAFYKQQGEVLV